MAAPELPAPALGASAQGDAELSCDTLLRGRLSLWQPRRGYRFSLDPVLLAGFVAPPYGCFVDVGAGCGVLGLLLLAADGQARGVGVELQTRLAELAARNALENHCADRLDVVCSDFVAWASAQPAASFDLIISNPPFYSVEGGHVSPNRERALAHHEVGMALPSWTAAAARLLAPNGRLAVIFPHDREHDLLSALQAQGLVAHRMRRARPTADRPHHRVLIEAGRSRSEEPRAHVELPELVVHAGEGFSPEVLRQLGEAP